MSAAVDRAALDAAAKAPAAAPARRRTRFRKLLLGACVLGIVAAGAAFALRQDWSGAPPMHYVTAPVSRGMVATSVTASGTVNAETVVQVGSYVSGVIQAVYCDFNTAVHRGQICAKIDPRLYQATADQQAAALATAMAQREKDRANLVYMAQAYGRAASLVKHRDASQETLDAANNNYLQAQAQMAIDNAVILQQTAALNVAKVNLGYTDIVSPVDGTVVSRSVAQGQTVAASFQTPTLFVIATDLSRMQVDTYVSESDISSVKPGAKAYFSVSGLPAIPFPAAVKQIRQAPQTVQNVVTYDVVLSADNKALLLKPGMTAVAHIVTAEHDGVLRVPSAALRYTPAAAAGFVPPAAPTTARVWVLRDGRPQPVPITAGLDDYVNTEVLAGDLQPQEQVIVAEHGDGGSSPGAP